MIQLRNYETSSREDEKRLDRRAVKEEEAAGLMSEENVRTMWAVGLGSWVDDGASA